MIEYIKLYFISLLELFNEMAPYLLLGFLFAGILHIYFPKHKVNRFIGKANLSSVVKSALLGIPLPLCSCGVIPTGVSFHKSGASKGAAVSFLISTPQTGIDSILVTYSLLGLPFALIRPIIALITGITGGIFTNVLDEEEQNAKSSQNISKPDSKLTASQKFREMFRYAFVEFMQDISKWLIIGLLVAALIAVLIPDDFFSMYIHNQFLSMFLVLLASVPLYVCATGSVPIAAVLLMKGISPGAALVFLMAGPATNVATITVIGKSMGRKTLIAYMLSIISGALIFGFLINTLLPSSWFAVDTTTGMHTGHQEHELLPYWFKLSSTIMLILLIINGYYQKYKENKAENKRLTKINKDMLKKVKVNGMTCNHCKANVETNLGKIEGIQSVDANITTSEVSINGDSINLEEVKKTVEDLGYNYNGEIS